MLKFVFQVHTDFFKKRYIPTVEAVSAVKKQKYLKIYVYIFHAIYINIEKGGE